MIYLDNNTGTQQVYIPRETMNIKTVPVGTGGANVDLSDYYTKEEIEQNYYAKSIMDEYINNTKDNTTYIDRLEESKQDVLYSGINIKTIKGESILGGGDVDFSEYYTKEEIDALFGEQVEVRCIKGLSDDMTDEIKAYNTETYNKLVDYADVVVFIGQWLMLNCHIRPQNNEVECFFKADTSRGFVGLGSIILKSDGTIEYGDMFELQRTVTFDSPASVTDFFTNSERYLSYDIMPNIITSDGSIVQATLVNVEEWVVEFYANGDRYVRHYNKANGELDNEEQFTPSSGDDTPTNSSECIVIQYVGDYTVDFDGNPVEYKYEGSERQQHNVEAIRKILSGEVCAVYYQYLHEQVYRNDEEYGYCNLPTWITMPLTYRYPSHDNLARFMGVAQKNEYATSNGLVTVGIVLRENNASIYSYKENSISGGGGTGGDPFYSWNYYTKSEIDSMFNNLPTGGGGYDSNPTFDSITVNGGAYFNSEIVMAGGGQSDNSDIAEGIACAFKAGKTQSIDQWVRNIHTGTDGQGLRVCSSDEYGGIQYMAVDTEGNIYEGNTKLSDKYASIDVIGDINNILSSI